MIQDQVLSKAVTEIRQRSDRQEDATKLNDTFVDVGILTQVENSNNQIVYGSARYWKNSHLPGA